VLFCQNVTRGKLRKALLYKKHTRKMLMKLTPVHLLPPPVQRQCQHGI